MQRSTFSHGQPVFDNRDTVTLCDGAPAKLSATDEGSENWKLFDQNGVEATMICAYDSVKGVVTGYAHNYVGDLAIDADTGQPVTYSLMGQFTVRKAP